MRLDQFLQKACLISRNEARCLLKAKKIILNGQIIVEGKHHIDLYHDEVYLDNQRLFLTGFRYYVLHKPKGYVCSHQYDGGIPVFDLINDKDRYELHCAGRLDLDTTGLVLLTDDGSWSHRITHPNHLCPKTYRVILEHPLYSTAINELERGVLLNGEIKKTKPAKVRQISECIIELIIIEGRYHQVKRMIAAVNNRVVALHRMRIGQISLDGLDEGEYRPLAQEEIEGLIDGK